MSSSKPLKSKKRDKENAKKSFADSPTVESDSNHEDLTGCDVLKSSLKRRESPKDVHKVSRKPFVIPRKNKQVKELFQSQHFDSREVRELLRHVNQSFRYQLSSSMFKFEKVEFVNNEKLRQKYAEKKQEMRIVLPKNRELEEKFGFLYTPSRSKVKEICEKGLQTGHCNLNFLGDPKLGVYVCRYADIVNKRQLDDEDKGYLIVFNVVKGRIKGISGGNPEQQPTPHHDCHVSKLFMNLTSSATHSEIYGASMFYFYEIDENSEDFHAKQPRQVLPYAVLTFSIIKPEVPQPRSGIEEAKNKDNVSRMSDNPVLSPLSEDVNDTIISASTVSWTGQLFYKNKFIGFINLVTYSMKKVFLPTYVDQKINICSKITLDHLKSVFKCPIFKNGKPSATGVSKEFNSGGMFTYYEVQPIYQERERFNKIMTYFKAENIGAVIEYIAGVAYMYILPTSQLTHDAGITDEKSPTSLHVLVHVKRICPFPGSQDNPQPTEMSGSSSSEESISSRVQEILKEKLNIKPKKKAQPPSLFTKKFVVNPKKSVDEPRFISVSDSLKERESRKTSDGKRKESTKSENSKVKVHRSESWAGNDHLGHEASTSNAYNNSSSISRYKWFNQNESNDLSSLGNESDKSCLNREIKTKRQEAYDARSESCKPESGQRQQGDSSKDSHSKGQNRGNLKRSSSLDTDASIDLASIQKLIESYKKDSSLSVVFSKKVSLPSVDPRPSEEQMASTDAGMIKEVKDIPDSCKHPSIPAPPLPPPLPLTSPPLPPLPPSNTPPLPPLPATISPFLIQSPVPSTPDASTKQSSSLSEALESLLSAWPSKNNTSGVSTSKSGKPQESSSPSGTWPSPPSVERKSMLIPGLEPPGSPVFNLIKDKQVLSIAKGRHGNIDHVKGHPTSPLAVDTKAIAPSPIINPQSIPLVKKISQNESSENVTSPCTIQEIPRTVTVAEQAASVEAKEKVMAILKQSAQAQADANTLPENVSFPDSGHMEVKSILKSTKHQSEAKQENVIDQSKTDLTVFNDVSSTPIAQFQESSVKVVSLNEYRQKQKEQNTSSLASNTAKTLNTTCTSSPELRSGLDLIDKLLSAEKGQASPDAKTESSEDTIVSSCKKTIANRDKDANGSRNSENGAPRKRRRIVTVKRKSQERTCGYDDMTSDISDEELPDDKITSDISDTELPEDYTEPDDARAEQKDPPRSMSRTDTLPKHKLLLRDEHGKRLNDMRSLSDREKSPQKKARSPLRSPSRMTFRDSNRHDSKSTSPDDWGREKKRRRIEMQQKDYRTGMHDRMEDNDSGSNMSISPITSPVSFEYANDGTYQSINSPLRGATLPLDSRGLGGMAMPRSPPEIGRIDSPGTPETALPATDFLHADIGYWSTGLTVADNAALPYGTLGYLETHVDSDLYESVKQTSVHPDIPRYEIRSNDMEYYEVANERHIQPPYYSNPRPISEPYQGQQNTASENHPTEEPRVDSRGEGFLVSGSSDIGDGSGYESPSYMELRRPFFGTTDDLILSAYDKNVTCTDYVDVYTCPSTRVDKLRDNDQDCYFMPRSPYEDVKSPCSPVTSDVELDRFEGRGPSSTPEYEDKQYQSDRRIVTVGEYPEYANRPESDDEERVQQCVDDYDPEEASYHDGGDYFSDNKLREPRYRDYDEEYETFDQRYCGLGQNTHLSNQYTYSSDDEDPLGVARLPSRHAYHSEDSKLRENFFSENEDFMRNARQSDRENYNSGDKTDYDRSMSPSSRDYHNSGAKDNMRSTRRSYRDYYSERNEDYVRDSRPSSRKAHNLEDENRMRDSRSSSRQAHNFDDKDYGRDSRPSSRQSHNLDDEGRMRDSRPSSRQAHNSDDEDRIRDSRPSSRQTHNFNDKDYARESRSSSRQEHNSKDGDDARDASQSSRPNYKSEDEYRARDTRRSNPDKYNSGNADCSRPSNRQKYDQGSKSDACSSSRRGTRYKNDFTSEDENITSGDYNERDYQYLDDIVKEDKEKTTLQLDNIVCEGLSRFPPNFRNLLQMQSHDNDSNADLVGRFQLSSEMQSLRDEDDEMTSDSPNKDSVNITSMISKNRDPRLNRRLRDTENNTDNAVHQTSGGLEEKDTNFDKVEPAYAQQASRVQSYFYVYEPENDSECKAVKTYMLKTGSQYFDVRDFNADKLKAVKGGIRVLIRGKHKSALHKINNLSKLKCLKNVKFALFNTVEDVAKKTRAYTAIFQYGGVLIPDDFILKRTHPAYLEALLRFMAEENAVHQKVFWVMNVRYQAYKKLGSQRPLSWRDTFILELLRKYRNEGFVNIIQKDYVTEGLSLIQRYLDTAWRQQRDLMTTYRHFIMLSNMEKQKSEASWFRNRGIGFMDIKTFLLGFAGDKKTKQLLFSSRYTVGGNVSTPNKNITGRERNTYDRTEIDSDQKSKESFPQRPPLSHMVSRSLVFNTGQNMKERRLQILSSIKDKKDNLINDIGGSPNVESTSESMPSHKEVVKHNDTTSSTTPSKLASSTKISAKDPVSTEESSHTDSKSSKDLNCKDSVSSKVKGDKDIQSASKDVGKSKDLARDRTPNKDVGSSRNVTRNRGRSPPKGLSRLGSPKEVSRSRKCSPKGIPRSREEISHKREVIPRNRARSPTKTTRTSFGSPKGKARKEVGSTNEFTSKNIASSLEDSGSNKEITRKEIKPPARDSNETNCKESRPRDVVRNDPRKLKSFVSRSNENKNSKEQIPRTQKPATWSRTVRSVVLKNRGGHNASFQRGRGFKRGSYNPRGSFGRGQKRRFVQERTANHPSNA